jgi:hypothetical protein
VAAAPEGFNLSRPPVSRVIYTIDGEEDFYNRFELRVPDSGNRRRAT